MSNIEYSLSLRLNSGTSDRISALQRVLKATSSTGKFTSADLDVETVEQPLPKSEVLTPGISLFANTAAASSSGVGNIELLDGPGGNVLTLLKPGEQCLMRLQTTTPYIRSVTNPAKMTYIVIED